MMFSTDDCRHEGDGGVDEGPRGGHSGHLDPRVRSLRYHCLLPLRATLGSGHLPAQTQAEHKGQRRNHKGRVYCFAEVL